MKDLFFSSQSKALSTFGNVYKVQDEAGHTFAQKRIRKDDPAIRAEVETMEALKQTGPQQK